MMVQKIGSYPSVSLFLLILILVCTQIPIIFAKGEDVNRRRTYTSINSMLSSYSYLSSSGSSSSSSLKSLINDELGETMFWDAIVRSGLENELENHSDGSLTIFVPTNEAMSPENTEDYIPDSSSSNLSTEEIERLAMFVKNHVVLENIHREDFQIDPVPVPKFLQTMSGNTIVAVLNDDTEIEISYRLSRNPSISGFEGSVEGGTNSAGSEIMVHKISHPLLPLKSIDHEILKLEELSLIKDLLEQHGINEDIVTDKMTLFLPSNAAFEEKPEILLLPAEKIITLLRTHMKSGITRMEDIVWMDELEMRSNEKVKVTSGTEEGFFIQDAQVVDFNNYYDNGVVHIVQSFVVPPSFSDIVSESPTPSSGSSFVFGSHSHGTTFISIFLAVSLSLCSTMLLLM